MQRLRRLFLRAPLLDAIPGGVLRVLGSPVRLRLLPPRRLTLRPATGALPRSYSWVGTEPMVADGTRSLPGRWHRESSSPCCCLGFRWRFSSDCLGNFSKAHLGNFSRAPKIVQHGKQAADRRLEHQLDLLFTLLGVLPQADPLLMEVERFFEGLFSGGHEPLADLDRLVEEAKKRLA